ncbi:hypothetical protein [Haloimpatiens massiliensis]|uniref:hypothetical protein n=1 Tax=Haloimpatiens massiliensis TaxID=1658110 RepID=UPI000C835960|nr:hypothetical protein [Haloimpatiens massiliensis]
MKKIFKNKKVIISLLIVICLISGGVFGYSNFISEKGQVKRVTIKLLKSIKNGQTDTSCVKDIEKFDRDFNQLFNYKILKINKMYDKNDKIKLYVVTCQIETNNEQGQKCTKRAYVDLDNSTGKFKSVGYINSDY